MTSDQNGVKKTRRKISDEVRKLIIKQSNEFQMKNSDISKLFNLPRTTVATIISAYNIKGQTSRLYSGGDHSSKLNANVKAKIRQWVDENATITLKNLKAKVFENFSLNVSTTTIYRTIKNFHYSLKKITIVPERRNFQSTIETRHNYALEFNKVNLENGGEQFVFIDEAGFNVSMRTKSGRSAVGTSAYVSVPAIRTKNISIIASMTNNGMVDYKVNDRPVNGDDFKSYLNNLNLKCLQKGMLTPVFVMDNARIHHYKGLKELIDELKLNVLYLPPYSPFLNPIENVFSKWKSYVCGGNATNGEMLMELINGGFLEITSSDCNGYFRKMTRYIVRCLDNEEIFE